MSSLGWVGILAEIMSPKLCISITLILFTKEQIEKQGFNFFGGVGVWPFEKITSGMLNNVSN